MAIETLKKIGFTNIEQFVEDINRNFAVVQSSPLYKGVPGKTGKGVPGLAGSRGIKFLFINYLNFTTQFPTELTNISQINLSYLNSKAGGSFPIKRKLLSALGINEFVDKDVVVLSNSFMLSYDFITEQFIDTGLAFNSGSNLTSTIEQQVEFVVNQKLSANSALNSLGTIFEINKSYSKNIPTNSLLPIQNLGKSAYIPYYDGIGLPLSSEVSTHKYWGFPDSKFSKLNDGTMIFGSVKRYIELIEATLDNNNNLNSNYSPGVGNIPALVILQNTPNAGILFGNKTSDNLKSFGSMYKDSEGNVIIKSDSGIITSQFSKLKIHRTGLWFDKKVFFGNDLSVGENLILGGNISNKYFRTAQYTSTQTAELLEIGSTVFGAKTNIKSDLILDKYKSRVLVTDALGDLSKLYNLETVNVPDYPLYSGPNAQPTIDRRFNVIPSSNYPASGNQSYGILTSKYLAYLYDKINAITAKIQNDYYPISDIFKINVANRRITIGDNISNTTINGNLTVKANTNYIESQTGDNIPAGLIRFEALGTDNTGNDGGGAIEFEANNLINLKSTYIKLDSDSILTKINSKILTTNNYGIITGETASTAFNKAFGTGNAEVARGDHNHSGTYEPVISKLTAFNANFGAGNTDVARGDHAHSDMATKTETGMQFILSYYVDATGVLNGMKIRNGADAFSGYHLTSEHSTTGLYLYNLKNKITPTITNIISLNSDNYFIDVEIYDIGVWVSEKWINSDGKIHVGIRNAGGMANAFHFVKLFKYSGVKTITIT